MPALDYIGPFDFLASHMSGPNDQKVALVRKLVAAGLEKELRLLLLGVSDLSGQDEEASSIYPVDYADGEGGFHLITWVCAHLEFTSEFGEAAISATRDGHLHFAHPTEYQRWLSDGAPGLTLTQVQAVPDMPGIRDR